MKGSRPKQSLLTAGNDLSKTVETAPSSTIWSNGLNDHEIDGIGAFLTKVFGGWAMLVVASQGLKEFQDNWQRPFQAAFSDKVCIDEARIVQGEWAAAFGRQEAVHTGEFMGIAPTGKRVEIRYMDFWKVDDGKISTIGSWSIFPTLCDNSVSIRLMAMVGKK